MLHVRCDFRCHALGLGLDYAGLNAAKTLFWAAVISGFPCAYQIPDRYVATDPVSARPR